MFESHLESEYFWLHGTHLLLTLPNQTLQGGKGQNINLNQHHDKFERCYQFDIQVREMDVFQRRDKPTKQCNIDWNNHNELIMNDIIRNVGCNPTHWKLKSSAPNCSTAKDYRSINEKYMKRENLMPPCRTIERLGISTKGKMHNICGPMDHISHVMHHHGITSDIKFEYYDKQYEIYQHEMWKWSKKKAKEFVEVFIYFNDIKHYNQYELVPAYTLQTLFGNAGMILFVRLEFLQDIRVSSSEPFL